MYDIYLLQTLLALLVDIKAFKIKIKLAIYATNSAHQHLFLMGINYDRGLCINNRTKLNNIHWWYKKSTNQITFFKEQDVQ